MEFNHIVCVSEWYDMLGPHAKGLNRHNVVV